MNDPKMIQEAMASAISLPGDHACRNNPEGICQVKSVIYDNLIFVSNEKYPMCPNYKPFGNGGFCTSPIRQEIYQKYKL